MVDLARGLGGEVAFEVPVDVAFAYLADPRHRPEWQSSLRSVEMLDEGEPRMGMRWRDRTKPGLAPQMQITAFDPGECWAEVGHWRGVSATLTLLFTSTPTGCAVDVRFAVTGRGPMRLLGRLVTLAAVLPVLADVRRAARILRERAG